VARSGPWWITGGLDTRLGSSLALAKKDEEDELEPEAGAPEHERLRRGGATVDRRLQWKLHDASALERGRELKSGLHRCGEGWGWCLPFIGARGVPGRRLPGVTVGI
jgi:hypothetical protein